ncbi:hypothetical protein JOM56_008736 [Amanita muscaria]
MDEEFTFGTSVWGSSDPVDLVPPGSIPITTQQSSPISLGETQFSDDFDTFATPAESIGVPDDDEDDGFGDFGDFGEAQGNEFDDANFGEPIAGSSYWQPLKLDPLPPRPKLQQQINENLEPLWADHDTDILTDEGIRELSGISQVLVTPESRDLYKMIQQPPSMRASNWTRSRIRRQHLIALGIPVNLDEVLPHVNGKGLPPLEITSRPMSAPPTRSGVHPSAPSSTSHSRAGTPQPVASHFGPKPELDREKIELLLGLDTETLNLLPLVTLEQRLKDLQTQTSLASTLLTHLLQTRESLQQDSETYNRLIGDLVGEAQRLKSGKPVRTASLRR